MDSKAGMVSYLRFVYGDNKGATQAGTMFNNSLYKGTSDPYYSSRQIANESLTFTKNDTTAELDYYPIIPETFEVSINGVLVPQTDLDKSVVGKVTFTLEAPDGGTPVTATLNLANGHIDVNGITDDTELDVDAVFDYEYDNETAPVKVPQINLELAQIPMVAKSRKLAAYWGFDAAFDLKKQLTCKVA